MIITEDLQQDTGDISAVYVELDKLARQYFKCLCQPHTVEQPEGMAKLSDFLNKSEHKGAEKLNDALVGMVMAQQQISVADAAKYALEECGALPGLCPS